MICAGTMHSPSRSLILISSSLVVPVDGTGLVTAEPAMYEVGCEATDKQANDEANGAVDCRAHCLSVTSDDPRQDR